MSLRKSFWDVSGYPDQASAEWQPYLETYAPESEYGDRHFVERQQMAKLNYLGQHFPMLTTQDAVLEHAKQTKQFGDLKFRLLSEGENREAKIVQACREFRDACQWWQKGGRLTQEAVEDAKAFENIARSWEIMPFYDERKDTDASMTVKREIELSCQFAVALQNTVAATANTLNDPQTMLEQREIIFREQLDHVFSR